MCVLPQKDQRAALLFPGLLSQKYIKAHSSEKCTKVQLDFSQYNIDKATSAQQRNGFFNTLKYFDKQVQNTLQDGLANHKLA